MTASARSSTQNSASTWRCSYNNRLHRDQSVCTETPFASPVFDSPIKRRWPEIKSAGGSRLRSPMSTEPTPPKPRADSKGGSDLEISLPSMWEKQTTIAQAPFNSPSPLPVLESAFDARTSKPSALDHDVAEGPATTPDQHRRRPQSSSFIPETLLPQSAPSPPSALQRATCQRSTVPTLKHRQNLWSALLRPRYPHSYKPVSTVSSCAHVLMHCSTRLPRHSWCRQSEAQQMPWRKLRLKLRGTNPWGGSVLSCCFLLLLM